MRKIEEKLNEVYEFTRDFIEDNGFPPSVREICAKLNIKSTATAYSYIEKLKERGMLNKSPLKKRALSMPVPKNEYKTIPLLGTIRAGSPIFAVENLDGYIPLPEEFGMDKSDFALRVEGDSMIKAGIFENDIIIVNKQDTAISGEIVVALVEDSATVKRLIVGEEKIILHPENDTMSDMIFDDVKILGVVTGLIRKF
jgi:repressor LexA